MVDSPWDSFDFLLFGCIAGKKRLGVQGQGMASWRIWRFVLVGMDWHGPWAWEMAGDATQQRVLVAIADTSYNNAVPHLAPYVVLSLEHHNTNLYIIITCRTLQWNEGRPHCVRGQSRGSGDGE